MSNITHGAAPTPADTLHAELRTLIARSRQRLAGAVNAELTRLYWSVGKRLHTEVLCGADRAKYGDQLIKRVGDQLAQEFGRGFEAKNLRRMVQFAQVFAEPEIVATLSRQLSWSHFVNLLPLKTEPARQFYANQAASQTWSVRELRHQIERKAFERTELATLQAPALMQAESAEALGTSALAQRKLPHRVRQRGGDYQPGADAIQVMTMKVSKGLEFPVVALPGVGQMPATGEDETEAARVFYVAATRATQRLLMGVSAGLSDGGLGSKLMP